MAPSGNQTSGANDALTVHGASPEFANRDFVVER